MTQLQMLPIDELVAAKDNVRRNVGDVSELAASIKAVGLLEPLVVTRNGEGHVVVAGSRRLAAARQAGLTEIPVVVRDLDDRQRLEAMLIENLQRVDLSPLEEAAGYQRLVDLGLKQKEIAERIGRSPAHISKRIGLLALTPKARKQLDAGKITLEDAGELLKLAAHPQAVDAVLSNGAGRDMRYAVKSQLRKIIAEEKAQAARAKLQKAGVTIVAKWDQYRDQRTQAIGKGWDAQLDVDARKHAQEACHAAYDGYSYWLAEWF